MARLGLSIPMEVGTIGVRPIKVYAVEWGGDVYAIFKQKLYAHQWALTKFDKSFHEDIKVKAYELKEIN